MATQAEAVEREMVNEYSGRCAECRRYVAVGAGTVRKEGGKWVLRCWLCEAGEEVAGDPGLAAYIETHDRILASR